MIKKRVFILGAGVSHSCGYPLAIDLLREFFNSKEIEKKDKEKISNFIQALFPSFVTQYENYPNIEDVLSMVEVIIEEKITISELAKEVKRILLWGIANFLCKFSRNKKPIEEFVTYLQEGDSVITFNWDFLLEEAILDANKKYS